MNTSNSYVVQILIYMYICVLIMKLIWMTKQKEAVDDDEAEDGGKGVKSSGRRKPAYAGGLVLDPKKGTNTNKI